MDVLIGNSSKEDGLVLDPFMGIGAAGVSAVGLNRNFIGIELDDGYFEIAKSRIESVNNN
jgi:site-specific DNA-methyltransferase (adenine-specific)